MGVSSKVVARFKPGGATHVLRTYLKLHKDRIIGQHWLWAIIERVNAGEDVGRVLYDYGYLNVKDLGKDDGRG